MSIPKKVKALTGWDTGLYPGCLSQYLNLCLTWYFYLLVKNIVKLDWVFRGGGGGGGEEITETKVLPWNIFPGWEEILRFLFTRLFKNHQWFSEERHKSPLLFVNLINLIGALFFFQDSAESAWLMAKGCILPLYLYQIKNGHIQVDVEQAGRETKY